MRICLDLDADTTERLVEAAVAERRPIVWQAEVLLRRSLGLPVALADRPADAPAERGREAVRC